MVFASIWQKTIWIHNVLRNMLTESRMNSYGNCNIIAQKQSLLTMVEQTDFEFARCLTWWRTNHINSNGFVHLSDRNALIHMVFDHSDRNHMNSYCFCNLDRNHMNAYCSVLYHSDRNRMNSYCVCIIPTETKWINIVFCTILKKKTTIMKIIMTTITRMTTL